MYPGPRATPTWHDGRVYFAGPRRAGRLPARRRRPAPLVGQRDRDSSTAAGLDFGYACSPLVEQGKVILPVGGRGASVVALDARRRLDRLGLGRRAGQLLLGDADHVRRPAARGRLPAERAGCCSTLETGRRSGSMTTRRATTSTRRLRCTKSRYLMIARPFRGGAGCYRLDCRRIPNRRRVPTPPSKCHATPVWFSRQMSNDVASSVLVDGYVYGFDLRDVQAKAHRPSRGKFTCLDLATGEVLLVDRRTGHATRDRRRRQADPVQRHGRGAPRPGHARPIRGAGPDPGLRRRDLLDGPGPGPTAGSTCGAHEGRLPLPRPARNPQPRVARRRATRRRGPQAERFDYTRLLGGEREYPADRPTPARARRVVRVSWSAVFGCRGLRGRRLPALRRRFPVAARRGSRVVFWIAAFAAGLPPPRSQHPRRRSSLPGRPACSSSTRSRWSPSSSVPARVEHEVGGGFPRRRACLRRSPGYFHVCRVLAMAAEWVFLLGFLPSWPIAIPAALRLRGDVHPVEDLLGTLSFSLYYWAAGAYLIWGPGPSRRGWDSHVYTKRGMHSHECRFGQESAADIAFPTRRLPYAAPRKPGPPDSSRGIMAVGLGDEPCVARIRSAFAARSLAPARAGLAIGALPASRADGILQGLRDDVRNPFPSSSGGSGDDDRRHHYYDDHCDDNDGGFYTFVGQVFLFGVTSPVWGPVAALDDDPFKFDGLYFPRFPYDHVPGYLMDNPCEVWDGDPTSSPPTPSGPTAGPPGREPGPPDSAWSMPPTSTTSSASAAISY